jgi:hypothetical protein
MYTVTFTPEQFQTLFRLLDTDLKRNGLNSLIRVVDLHNLLSDVAKQPPAPPNVPQPQEPKGNEEKET